MHRRNHVRRQFGLRKFASLAANAEISSEQGLRRGGPKTNQNFWFHESDLGVQPGSTCVDFRCARFFVNATFAPFISHPLKVLNYIRDVDFASLDACLSQRAIEEQPRRTDKGPTCEIFSISRLLANEHHLGGGYAFTEGRSPTRANQAAILVLAGSSGWPTRLPKSIPVTAWPAAIVTSRNFEAGAVSAQPGWGSSATR